MKAIKYEIQFSQRISTLKLTVILKNITDSEKHQKFY